MRLVRIKRTCNPKTRRAIPGLGAIDYAGGWHRFSDEDAAKYMGCFPDVLESRDTGPYDVDHATEPGIPFRVTAPALVVAPAPAAAAPAAVSPATPAAPKGAVS